jgi:RNA polymerase sigma-70 factor, ECF subfamily
MRMFMIDDTIKRELGLGSRQDNVEPRLDLKMGAHGGIMNMTSRTPQLSPEFSREARMSENSPEDPSFEEVAEELSVPLQRYLERMVGNRATADDLLQETLLRIARGLPGFEGRASVKTWAFKIATRVATDHFRRPDTRAQVVDMDQAELLPVLDNEGEERIVIDEMNSCMREVIDSLPEDYRAALILHDIQGLTAAATAEACGCSLATAKIRIHRARTRLREALKAECEFYRDEADVFRCDRKSRDEGS